MCATGSRSQGGNGTRTGADIKSIENYFVGVVRVLQSIPFKVVKQIVDELLTAYREDRAVYVFGNGGSAALASHSACDLGKGTATPGGKRLRVLSLTDNVPLITAWANDTHYEQVFAEQLKSFVRPRDVALAISGSGNSPNVLKALTVARGAKAVTIGLTGNRGGKMKDLCDVCLVVPSDCMQLIEDMHLCITHAIFSELREKIRLEAEACRLNLKVRQAAAAL